jgi:hypothetical protein
MAAVDRPSVVNLAIIVGWYGSPVLFSTVPGLRFRLKDLPYIKSLLPPVAIAGVLVIWPCVENATGLRAKECLVFVWCLLALTINGLVFDYRDIEGDSAVGGTCHEPSAALAISPVSARLSTT